MVWKEKYHKKIFESKLSVFLPLCLDVMCMLIHICAIRSASTIRISVTARAYVLDLTTYTSREISSKMSSHSSLKFSWFHMYM
jgi:hypothetical protein